MFYEPKDGHGLPHNPFNAIVTPRPIGWVSTRDTHGVDNLAPYSFFNAVAYVPPQVMFASTGGKSDHTDSKDSVNNIRETGVFCINVVGQEMIDAMNISSANLAKGVDEFAKAGLDKTECQTIACSRVAQAPAALECKVTQIVTLNGENNFAVFGEVIGVHMQDACMVDGKFDVSTFTPVARLGYRDYSLVNNTFELSRPDD